MTAQASLTVRQNASHKGYDRRIFGGFLEHFGRQIYGGVFDPGSPLADAFGFRQDVISALRELAVPIVRWPGGCYVSGYHWKDGVGFERSPTDDMAWGVIEPHSFGTDEFIRLCHELACEPYICNNAGNGSIEEMQNWLAYCNARQGPYAEMRMANGHDKPHNVNIWSIGNENWGKHEIGYKAIEQWAPFVREAARALKAVDPDIQLSAAALPDSEWLLPMLEQAGDYLDYISLHSYWLGLWAEHQTPDYLSCIMESEGPEKLISEAISTLELSGYRGRIKIAYDEWNLRGWHHPGFPRKTVQDYHDPEVKALIAAREKNLIASQYTMADALFSASFLNACLRHAEDIAMANIAPLVNTRGPLFVHPEGVVRRTHFHTFAMYANLLGEKVVAAELSSEPLSHDGRTVAMVDALVTFNEREQRLVLSLINRHPSERKCCKLVIHEKPLEGLFDATVLAADSPEAYNDISYPDRVTPEQRQVDISQGEFVLPPHALTILQVPIRT